MTQPTNSSRQNFQSNPNMAIVWLSLRDALDDLSMALESFRLKNVSNDEKEQLDDLFAMVLEKCKKSI